MRSSKKSFDVLFCACLSVFCLRSVHAVSVGKVNVGYANSSSEELYFGFNENYVNDLFIPVFITVETNSNPPDQTIRIHCELNPSSLGYTSASFSPANIIFPSTVETTISFSNTNCTAGRPTTVQCWAVPVGTPPADAPKFSKAQSIGQTGLFEIRAAGSVAVCDGLVVVAEVTADQQFYVELSEPVEVGTAARVECSRTTGGVGSMNLDFDTPVNIPFGQRRTMITYRVTQLGDSVEVTCTAETFNSTGNQQFIVGTSGRDAQFIPETGSVDLQPYLTNLRTTEMTSFLVVSGAAREELTFYCGVELASSVSDAESIISAPGCQASPPAGSATTAFPFTTGIVSTEATTEGTTTPPSNTSGWMLRNQLIIIPQGGRYAPVKLYRVADDVYAQDSRPQLVVIRCCAPDTLSDPRFEDAVVGLLAAAYLSPNYTTDWDQATPPGEEETEREVLPTQYVELSSCPCNLTHLACDPDCCCDPDCSSADTDVFNCIPGIPGGEAPATPEYRCSAEYFGMEDWFPFLCVQYENSAFLGYFRQARPATRSSSEFNDLATQYRPDYAFEEEVTSSEQEKPPVEEGGASDGYTDGIAVKTGLQKAETMRRGPNYRLVLPGRAGASAGECVFATPVRYLRESQHDCLWRMREQLCAASSPLNARNYALPSQGGSALCAKGLLLLGRQGVQEVAYTNVDYLCAGDNATLLAHYLRSDVTRAQAYPPDQPKLFDYELPNGGDDCEFDGVTGAYLCEPLEVGLPLPPAPLPPRCSWDDGNTDAPEPSLNTSAGAASPLCRNAVLDVYYNFTWDGDTIVQLNATVVLGHVPFTNVSAIDPANNPQSSFLTQLFKVDYTNLMNYTVWEEIESSINEDPNQDNITLPWTRDQYTRSGKEGYLDGLPVFSGIGVTGNASDTVEYVDTSLTSQCTLWSPGADGLCESAGRTGINFSQNAIGSCLLRLGFDQLHDCNYTRKLVLNRQDNLMLANYIALTGDPNPADLTHWVQVLRENISYIFEDSVGESNYTDFTNDTAGVCARVPAGIHVDILWAKAGEHDYLSLNDIVGARISYTLHTWTLACSAGVGVACYGDSQWRDEIANGTAPVQSFTLQSSVAFIEVPPTDPPRKTQWELYAEERDSVCRHDACWSEAFYPWTGAYRGGDSDVVLGTSLAFLVFLIGAWAISRPWY